MPQRKLILILCLLLGFENHMAFSQTKFDTLTKSLQQVFDKDSLPGLAVVLVNSQKIIYKHNFGYADIAKKRSYSSASIQNIGSVSKTFCAVALMKAIELGYFNLETDINTILPFKVVNPNYPDGHITIRELTNHSSGIIDNSALFPDTYQFDTNLSPYDTSAYKLLKGLGYNNKIPDSSLKDFFYNYLSASGKYYTKNNFGQGKPGGTSRYSNVGSALAAYIIEVASGMSYTDFVSKYILKPLNMNNSSWTLDAKKLNQYTRPYYNRQAAFPYFHVITYPDGGLRTTTTDLSKYLIALIKGYHGDERLLKNESYKAMFTPQFSKENPPAGISLVNRNKGIFWNLYTNGTIGHDGDDPGVSTFLFFNPATGMGGVFLCNKYLADKSELINLLVKFTNEK